MSRFVRSIVAALLIAAFALGASAQERPKLVVYTYGSMISWGPAAAIKEGFEALHDVEVVYVAPGSTGETLGRLALEMETGGSDADVFFGLADTLAPQALARGVFRPYDPELIPRLKDVDPSLFFDETGRLVPHNYAYLAFLYHPERLGGIEPPATLEDLTDERFASRVIVQDARSAPGQGFLMWTIAEYGEEGYLDYWRRLKPSLLTITGGWSEAYSMFEAGEAPIVLSYATDRVAAVVYGGEPVHEVVTPGGQAYRQIEVAGIVRTSKNVELAHAFIDYLLSPEAQTLLAEMNVAFPANIAMEWPEVFVEHAVIPENPVYVDPEVVNEKYEAWLQAWSQVISE